MNAELRDTLADLLGEVVAHARKDCLRQTDEIVAGLREKVAHLEEKIAALSEAAKSLIGPAGKDGEPGKEGPQGRDGRDGLPGVPGPPGLDGKDGKDGKDGIDGIDGPQGETGRDGIISAEALVDAYNGVWAAREYERGSLVTFAGSLFLCLAKTTDKPETSENWKLIVKRGRDGKDGKNGAKGEKGDRGPMGHYKGID